MKDDPVRNNEPKNPTPSSLTTEEAEHRRDIDLEYDEEDLDAYDDQKNASPNSQLARS